MRGFVPAGVKLRTVVEVAERLGPGPLSELNPPFSKVSWVSWEPHGEELRGVADEVAGQLGAEFPSKLKPPFSKGSKSDCDPSPWEVGEFLGVVDIFKWLKGKRGWLNGWNDGGTKSVG